MMTEREMRIRAKRIAGFLNDPDTPAEDRPDLSLELSILQQRLGALGIDAVITPEEE